MRFELYQSKHDPKVLDLKFSLGSIDKDKWRRMKRDEREKMIGHLVYNALQAIFIQPVRLQTGEILDLFVKELKNKGEL